MVLHWHGDGIQLGVVIKGTLKKRRGKKRWKEGSGVVFISLVPLFMWVLLLTFLDHVKWHG